MLTFLFPNYFCAVVLKTLIQFTKEFNIYYFIFKIEQGTILMNRRDIAKTTYRPFKSKRGMAKLPTAGSNPGKV